MVKGVPSPKRIGADVICMYGTLHVITFVKVCGSLSDSLCGMLFAMSADALVDILRVVW